MMIIKNKPAILSSEITDFAVFNQRRKIIKALLAITGAGIIPAWADTEQIWKNLPKSELSSSLLTPTPADIVKNYTNYYEFTFDKEDATTLAQALKIDPWSIEISGEVEKPGNFHLEDLLGKQTIEERVYRFRCVEAWSMVVPWVGFRLPVY
jgi:sulfoxide reductase catalytic subunit YedY